MDLRYVLYDQRYIKRCDVVMLLLLRKFSVNTYLDAVSCVINSVMCQ